MLLRRHFYFLRSCPLMCIWYVWGYCENKVPIEGCQSVEWWHIFCMCSGRLVSISACEEQEQDEMKQVKQSRAARAQGQGAKVASLWASQFLALHLVCGELCKVVVRWKGRVYRPDLNVCMDKTSQLSWAWWLTHVNPALRRLKQEVNLGYTVKHWLKYKTDADPKELLCFWRSCGVVKGKQ